MAETLTELLHNVQVFDPKTGLPTQTFLQKFNALIRAERENALAITDHETRIDALEP